MRPTVFCIALCALWAGIASAQDVLAICSATLVEAPAGARSTKGPPSSFVGKRSWPSGPTITSQFLPPPESSMEGGDGSCLGSWRCILIRSPEGSGSKPSRWG
jgi:hypothetical protein